jgi:hypothetical protein
VFPSSPCALPASFHVPHLATRSRRRSTACVCRRYVRARASHEKGTRASLCGTVQESTKNLLKSSGVDVDTITSQATSATKTVTEASAVAAPTVNKVVNFLSTSTPETLGKIAVVLVAVYYLTPFALKTAVSSFRGYAGNPLVQEVSQTARSDACLLVIT